MLSSSFWMDRRVLLTGHTGFKGSWLLLWLQELGAQVWTFALDPPTQPNLFSLIAYERPSGDRWHNHIGDLSDFNSLKSLVLEAQPEVVIPRCTTLSTSQL